MPSTPKKQPRRSYQRKPQPKQGTGEQGFYNGQPWRKCRAAYVADHPLCAVCYHEGKITAVEVVDHLVPVTAQGAKYDSRNHMAMCHRHHNRKRGYESKGWVPDCVKAEDGYFIPTRAGRQEVLQKLSR